MTRVDEIYDDLELIIAEHKAFRRVVDENTELKSAIEDIKAEIIKHSYPVCYDRNSIENGMTITGIMEVFDNHINRKEQE